MSYCSCFLGEASRERGKTFTPYSMETPSTPKPTAPKKPVYVGNIETSGDTWTDVREATKVHPHFKVS